MVNTVKEWKRRRKGETNARKKGEKREGKKDGGQWG